MFKTGKKAKPIKIYMCYKKYCQKSKRLIKTFNHKTGKRHSTEHSKRVGFHCRQLENFPLPCLKFFYYCFHFFFLIYLFTFLSLQLFFIFNYSVIERIHIRNKLLNKNVVVLLKIFEPKKIFQPKNLTVNVASNINCEFHFKWGLVKVL